MKKKEPLVMMKLLDILPSNSLHNPITVKVIELEDTKLSTHLLKISKNCFNKFIYNYLVFFNYYN